MQAINSALTAVGLGVAGVGTLAALIAAYRAIPAAPIVPAQAAGEAAMNRAAAAPSPPTSSPPAQNVLEEREQAFRARMAEYQARIEANNAHIAQLAKVDQKLANVEQKIDNPPSTSSPPPPVAVAPPPHPTAASEAIANVGNTTERERHLTLRAANRHPGWSSLTLQNLLLYNRSVERLGALHPRYEHTMRLSNNTAEGDLENVNNARAAIREYFPGISEDESFDLAVEMMYLSRHNAQLFGDVVMPNLQAYLSLRRANPAAPPEEVAMHMRHPIEAGRKKNAEDAPPLPAEPPSAEEAEIEISKKRPDAQALPSKKGGGGKKARTATTAPPATSMAEFAAAARHVDEAQEFLSDTDPRTSVDWGFGSSTNLRLSAAFSEVRNAARHIPPEQFRNMTREQLMVQLGVDAAITNNFKKSNTPATKFFRTATGRFIDNIMSNANKGGKKPRTE